MTRNNIVAAQEADMTLRKCFSSVVPLEIAHERKTAYYVDNGLLMRRWCTNVSDDFEWSAVNQIVVPVCYRQAVLRWPMTMLCLDTWALRKLTNEF